MKILCVPKGFAPRISVRNTSDMAFAAYGTTGVEFIPVDNLQSTIEWNHLSVTEAAKNTQN